MCSALNYNVPIINILIYILIISFLVLHLHLWKTRGTRYNTWVPLSICLCGIRLTYRFKLVFHGLCIKIHINMSIDLIDNQHWAFLRSKHTWCRKFISVMTFGILPLVCFNSVFSSRSSKFFREMNDPGLFGFTIQMSLFGIEKGQVLKFHYQYGRPGLFGFKPWRYTFWNERSRTPDLRNEV